MSDLLLVILLATVSSVYAADSVDVVFRYNISPFPSGLSVPGEFNNWNNTAALMNYRGGTLWTKTIRLAVGGSPGGGVPGAWQYKFYYSGVAQWPNDPLNHHVNHADNDNSFIYLKDPTIYQFLPNQRNPIVTSATPTISAYIFPKVGGAVDTSSISLNVDGTIYTGLGENYNTLSQQFVYTLPSPLQNGNHTAILHAGLNADTVNFITQSGFVQIQNEFPFTTWKTVWPINGLVQDTSVSQVKIVRNGIDTFTVSVTNKTFSFGIPLVEGSDVFVALADSSGIVKASSPVTFIRKVNHTPTACGTLSLSKDKAYLFYDATCSSDPDSNSTLSYLWKDDPSNPQSLGIDGMTIPVITTFSPPTSPGEYHINLIVSDNDGNKDTTRLFFEVEAGGAVRIPVYNENPSWAQKGRVYFLFPKAASPAGTINAAAQRLQSIKDLGFNVIWMMPVMTNASPINNFYGPGYNIIDFYTVAPEYGTNQDYKNFIAQAHALGLKVIQDITPNHSSRYHPWSVDAHTFKQNSPYWGWYEHQEITSNTNGLGDCLDTDGFNYYCGFSDQLLNFNWKDVDMQAEMINTFKYWVQEFGMDGFRFDVYWGPHRRYGEQYMGKPVRDALKHIKPDVLLLGEDDGTGAGTETIYADNITGGFNGGLDAAYDFKLYFNQIENFYPNANIASLHIEIDNGGYYPGKDALYMRFMESQDADRIVYQYSNNFAIDSITTFKRTMPMASVLFTIPGLPMLWNGQEVGWGYGIQGQKEDRARSVIDWNYAGRLLLAPHYQRLANIRGQFSAFTQHKRDTNNDGQVTSADSSDFMYLATGNGTVYAFARPYPDQNGLTVVNFSGSNQNVTLHPVSAHALLFSGGIQPGTQYYLNNLYTNSSQMISGSALDSVSVLLPPFGTAIYTVSTTLDTVVITNPITSVKETNVRPRTYELLQNYPNPFNPTTDIGLQIGDIGWVKLEVFDVLGRKVATLADERMLQGTYTISWNAGNMPSGVYFYRLTTRSFMSVKKMLLVR